MPLTSGEKQQIDDAIQAHGAWIGRLNAAIQEGRSEFSVDAVKLDNRCDFGRWLYGAFPSAYRRTPVYEEIRAKHAAFHQCAARALGLALSGRTEEAKELLEYQGEFMLLSGGLILKLRALRDR